MSYFNIAQEGHVVSILPPIDIDTASGATSESFNMEGWSHASIIITAGATTGASVVTVSENTDASQSDTTAIAFKLAKEETALGDTLGALTAVASTGFTMSTNDGIIYVIELDAADLSAGYNWVTVHFADPSGSVIASAVAVLSGGRYAGDQSATAIA
jgi:hypothetical protein